MASTTKAAKKVVKKETKKCDHKALREALGNGYLVCPKCENEIE